MNFTGPTSSTPINVSYFVFKKGPLQFTTGKIMMSSGFIEALCLCLSAFIKVHYSYTPSVTLVLGLGSAHNANSWHGSLLHNFRCLLRNEKQQAKFAQRNKCKYYNTTAARTGETGVINYAFWEVLPAFVFLIHKSFGLVFDLYWASDVSRKYK